MGDDLISSGSELSEHEEEEEDELEDDDMKDAEEDEIDELVRNNYYLTARTPSPLTPPMNPMHRKRQNDRQRVPGSYITKTFTFQWVQKS
jgi:hypothetical protein